MKYRSLYSSPIGKIIILANDKFLLGLWFDDNHININLSDSIIKDNDIILKTKKWLDLYFKNIEPKFYIPIYFRGTKFEKDVWNELLNIPYGHITTYGEIAQKIAQKRNLKRMSAQAVGKALNHNNILIIIPCHRVIGKNKSLIGYVSGINKKKRLLEMEGITI